MNKWFWVTVKKRVTFCDDDECPLARDVRVGKKYSTIHCGALRRRIRWSADIDFPARCPSGKRRRKS